MELFIATVILVLLAVLSIGINRRFLPKISVNYISMFFGAIIALIPFTDEILGKFDADMFMAVIVAPLLFFEGQFTRMNMVGRHLRLIVSLTVGMVVLCAIAAGFASFWAGGIGLPLAFILAAISTPTDATAMESVTIGLKLPHKESNALKLESLFNDASGIILLNMAILWYVNGHIAYGQTIGNFIYSALGGIIFGFIISIVFVYIRENLFRSRLNYGNNTYNNGTPFLVTYILTPFIIYSLAELIDVSGIIAVVFAGLVHNAEAERSSLINPKAMYDGDQLVDLISDILNSFVFIVLGIMLIRTATDRSVTYQGSLIWIVLGVTLYLANLLVRFLYSRFVTHFSNREALIFSIGGIHGAVTFALAFTVAASQVKTADYNLVIMSESLLILLSMIVPTIVFRFVLPKVTDDKKLAAAVIKMRTDMVQKAIEFVEQSNLSEEFRLAIIYDLKSQGGQTTVKQFIYEWRRMIRHDEYTTEQMSQITRTFTQVFQIEREFLIEQYNKGSELDEISFNKLYQEIAMSEVYVLEYGV